MKINVYDFDGTIYDGDSSIDFYWFYLRKNKKELFHTIKILLSLIQYKRKKKKWKK
ncbi:MAG: hypothetical protein IJ193_01860 [Bacilli bacterium]|nr:hypothetical protein [Bacilli bacterium]